MNQNVVLSKKEQDRNCRGRRLGGGFACCAFSQKVLPPTKPLLDDDSTAPFSFFTSATMIEV